MARHGPARARHGMAWIGPARLGEARRGEGFAAWHGMAGLVWVWRGKEIAAGRGLARQVGARRGAVWFGTARRARKSRRGWVGRGLALLGLARPGGAWKSWPGVVGYGAAWRGLAHAWRGPARNQGGRSFRAPALLPWSAARRGLIRRFPGLPRR